ncbi:hypothetical protein [Metabacillus fastidiosus]|uniref:hypothetical protein n=1 Tax=Metabacillus fastidiosus TaxID=1458 RepID=UPI003D2811B3
MTTQSLQPILITGSGDHQILWNWFDLYESRLAIIGDNRESNKQQHLKRIAEDLTEKDPRTVFWIKSEEGLVNDNYDSLDYYNLMEFEQVPTENVRGKEEFDRKRMDFVQLFLETISLVKGESRLSLIPLTSYRENVEGPLMGYVRALEKIDDEEKKEWLSNQFDSLRRIEWKYFQGEGYQYLYQNGTVEETLLSFLKGIWSYWALTSNLAEPQQMLMIIEVPKQLTDMTASKEVKTIIQKLLASIIALTEEITLATIVSTETFFPIPELNMRHHLYFKYNSSDFDWREEEKRSYFPDELIKMWEAGSNNAAFLVDLATGNALITDHMNIELYNPDKEALEQEGEEQEEEKKENIDTL